MNPAVTPGDQPGERPARSVTHLRHGRISLALHRLRGAGDAARETGDTGEGDAAGRPLLILHGLGERAPRRPISLITGSWPGPILALDFTGHGESTVPLGGGYTVEVLMGDVDCVIEHVGPVTLLGRGLGAYVALLAAGSRPEAVRGTVIVDGPGLAGGGSTPPTVQILTIGDDPGPPDPWALAELSTDVRPPSYAVQFVHHAARFSGIDDPISVSSLVRPPWLKAVLETDGAVASDVAAALQRYRALD